jgi:hypothetical protein
MQKNVIHRFTPGETAQSFAANRRANEPILQVAT